MTRRIAVKKYVGDWSDYLTKKQVALGLSAGTAVFWMAAQSVLEAHHIKNFYNEGDRHWP
jgi:hypothetical protein